MTLYLDSSAIVKLVAWEEESEALTASLDSHLGSDASVGLVSADIARTEVLAAVSRAGLPLTRAYAVLETLVLLRLTPAICESAGVLAGEQDMRSLDALHLAVAVSMRDSLHGLVTYDQRLGRAATRMGLSVLAPS